MKESGEMYLETILILSMRMEHVRSIDVAEEMKYSKPSVSRAINKLKNGGFISVDNKGYLTLNDSGRRIAEKIYERHQVLSRLLISLGVDEKTAVEDACRIEHDISDNSFDVIKKHYHTHIS